MTVVTRRNMLTGAAACDDAAGAANLTTAEAADNAQDVGLFVALSSLDGDRRRQAGARGRPDPDQNQYYAQAKSDPGFDGVMKIIRDNHRIRGRRHQGHDQHRSGHPLSRSQHHPGMVSRLLVRASNPCNTADAAALPGSAGQSHLARRLHQGWTWRVAQTHPMGYSDFRFGYWAEDPPALNDFIKK